MRSLLFLVLSVMVSTFLVDGLQDIARWVGCALKSQGGCTNAEVHDSRMAGLAVGGFLAMVLATYSVGQQTKHRREAVSVILGTLFGGLLAILGSVEQANLPRIGEASVALYIYMILLCLFLPPMILIRAERGGSWLLSHIGLIALTALIGLVLGAICNLVLTHLPAWAGWEASDFVAAPYAVVPLSAMWGTAVAAPRDGQAGVRRDAWPILYLVGGAVLCFGYGALVHAGPADRPRLTGVGAGEWGLVTLVVLFVPVCVSALAAAFARGEGGGRFWKIAGVTACGVAVSALLLWLALLPAGWRTPAPAGPRDVPLLVIAQAAAIVAAALACALADALRRAHGPRTAPR